MGLVFEGTFEVKKDELLVNELSANKEDDSTFDRLKHDLGKNDVIVDMPSVLLISEGENNGKYRIIAGHHRIKAWFSSGDKKTVSVNVFSGELEKEEEFDLVNNLNLTRGRTTIDSLQEIIRTQSLDVTKVDLYKNPSEKLIPQIFDSKVRTPISEIQKKQNLKDLSAKLAKKIASVMIRNNPDVIVCFRIEDKPVTIINISNKFTSEEIRHDLKDLKKILKKSLAEWINDSPEINIEDEDEENIEINHQQPILFSE